MYLVKFIFHPKVYEQHGNIFLTDGHRRKCMGLGLKLGQQLFIWDAESTSSVALIYFSPNLLSYAEIPSEPHSERTSKEGVA
jgi:hypothetical protein